MPRLRSPKVPDTVFWMGTRWRIVEVLHLGRLVIQLEDTPGERWVCLREHLRWNQAGRGWVLGVDMSPLGRYG